jgi:TonB-dependent receptor-like protein
VRSSRARWGWTRPRYGYPNVLLSIFAPELSLAYGDYTFRLTHKLNDKDSISLFAIGAYDTEKDQSGELLPVDTRFQRVDLRFDHRWEDGRVRLATTIGDDRTSARTFGLLSTPFAGSNDALTETSVRVRAEISQRLGAFTRLSAGADANGLVDHSGSANVPNSQQIAGAFLELDVHANDRVAIIAGARVDGYRSPGGITGSVDPRVAVRIHVFPAVTSITTVGVAHQPPTYLLPVPGLRLDPADGLQAAYQYAQGAEVRLPWAMSTTLTAFYNADRAMNDFVSDCGAFAINCNVVSRVDGATYGLELIVERTFSQRLAGWLSYTLSRAERHIGAVSFLSPFDRTHVVSAVVRYDFGHGIDVGLRGTYNTGRPEVPTILLDGQSLQTAFATTGVPQHQLPDFYRLDVRASKRWELGGTRWLAAVLEFFNVTLNKEAVNYDCNILQWRCTAVRVGPIALPSIGLEGGF